MINADQKSSKKKWGLSQNFIKNHQSLRFLGKRLHDHNLWYVTRFSVSVGAFIGLFLCFLPIPFQMVCAVVLAVLLRANIWVSVGLVWVSNPITVGPMMIFAYQVGYHLLHNGEPTSAQEVPWHHLLQNFAHIWQPLLLGCFVSGIVLGLCGFIFVHVFWKLIYQKFYSA